MTLTDRKRQIARLLTLLAAMPLATAACDPPSTPSGPPQYHSLPTPTCKKDPSSWVGMFKFRAAPRGAEIDLTVTAPAEKPWLQAPTTYTVLGGTMIHPDLAQPNLLRIRPDTGVTAVQLIGDMTCHTIPAQLTITVDLARPGVPVLQIDAS